MTSRTTTSTSDYLLGHDEQELARLEHQAAVLAPATRTILGLAGIAPGMRVLDLGTGAGDVAFEVAGLVGPQGSVVGVDRSVKALRSAALRAERRELTNVSFIHDDVHTVPIDDEFDAVVGRLILLYMPDPAEVLSKFARLVRPGGVVAMMEYDMRAAGPVPPDRAGRVDRPPDRRGVRPFRPRRQPRREAPPDHARGRVPRRDGGRAAGLPRLR